MKEKAGMTANAGGDRRGVRGAVRAGRDGRVEQ